MDIRNLLPLLVHKNRYKKDELPVLAYLVLLHVSYLIVSFCFHFN